MSLPATRGLYAISPETGDDDRLLAWADAVIDGGAVWLQYRDKSGDRSRRLDQAGALARLCRRRGVRFLVNDDIDLAVDAGADGVHLGEHDAGPERARQQLGKHATIGVSCYDDANRARRLAEAGADYLAFGAFFPTRSKTGTRQAPVGLLAEARPFGRPLVAIGGITPDNGAGLIHAGADLLAVIGGLAGTPDQARTAARRYAALFDLHPDRQDRP